MRTLAPLFLGLLLLASLTGCVRRVVSVPADDTDALGDPPPGQVRLNLESDNPNRTWNVLSQTDGVLCQTPCTQTVSVNEPLLLESNVGAAEMQPLAFEAPGAQRALVVAVDPNRALKVNGIVWTTLGGMGMVVAITLTAVGCSNLERRGGTCTAGLITGGVTAPLTTAGILMLVNSGPSVQVLPVLKTRPAPGQTPVSVAFTPTGVVGTF